jgi:hypothetical protein
MELSSCQYRAEEQHAEIISFGPGASKLLADASEFLHRKIVPMNARGNQIAIIRTSAKARRMASRPRWNCP